MTTAAYKQKRSEKKSDTLALKEFLAELLLCFTIAIPFHMESPNNSVYTASSYLHY